jgi:N,N'-diacetylchitobiose transport system permease protein
MVFPVFWMISTAFKSDDEILSGSWLPLHPTLQHFRSAIAGADHPYFWNSVVNSLIVVGVAVALSMVLAFFAAVALAKYRFTGLKVFIVLMIGIQMLPQAGLIIPLYLVLRQYGMVRTLSGVTVTYMTFVLPFAVWTLRGFIIGIPRELEEAAMVDGSSRVGAFVRILLPLVAPGLVATSVFVFITSWNEFIFANVLLNDNSRQTVTRVALLLHRDVAPHRLGCADGRVDADRDPGRRLLHPRPAEDRVRPHRRRRQRLNAWEPLVPPRSPSFFGGTAGSPFPPSRLVRQHELTDPQARARLHLAGGSRATRRRTGFAACSRTGWEASACSAGTSAPSNRSPD